MDKNVAIIGAGPSGIFCALQLAEKKPNLKITIFEKNKVLRTILLTGGGRCNLSFMENDIKTLASNYPRGEKFLYSVFHTYNVSDTLEYFEKIGIKTYVQQDFRIFPQSNSAKDVREKLLEESRKHKNIKIAKFEVKSLKDVEKYDKIVFATGGHSNYSIISTIGHTIKPTAPSLLGYITKEKYPQGVSININGEALLFTHQGISGPFTYKHSSINAYEPFPRHISLPLIDFEQLKNRVKENPHKKFGNVVSEFIPKSLAQKLVENYDKQCANVTHKEMENLKTLEIEATGIDNKGEIVTAGGVSLDEVDKYCCSKINNKFYFIGEVLDIDGFTGGFNLQNCWSSAYCAAEGISKSV